MQHLDDSAYGYHSHPSGPQRCQVCLYRHISYGGGVVASMKCEYNFLVWRALSIFFSYELTIRVFASWGDLLELYRCKGELRAYMCKDSIIKPEVHICLHNLLFLSLPISTYLHSYQNIWQMFLF